MRLETVTKICAFECLRVKEILTLVVCDVVPDIDQLIVEIKVRLDVIDLHIVTVHLLL